MIDYSNYKTIKQIADEIGVSKQAVQQKIKKEPLATSLKELSATVDGVIHINIDGQTLIKSTFTKKETESKLPESPPAIKNSLPESLPTNNSALPESIAGMTKDYIDNLLKQIEMLTADKTVLQEQLNEEKEHSRMQASDLQDKIINQSDRIADLAEKLAELTRNSQILLKQEQDKNSLLLTEQSTTASSEPGQDGMKLKRPFWQFWKK